LLGALALAAATGLTACGDKVSVVQPPADSTVHTVTVSPPAVTLQVNDVFTFTASVDAGAGVADRTVTWTSSNAAVATVDANGTVTAKGGGNASIVAASKANPAVKGSAVVTVGAVVQPTVTISTINQTTGAGSVPAVLGNVIGQLDVTLNVDPGTQKLSEVDLVATVAGKDTIVAVQTLSSSDVVPLDEAASAPITLSFNTASFNGTTGVTAFKNGQITIKGVAKTTQGTQSASGGQALTLNNTDALVGSVATGATKQDNLGQSWSGTSITVTVVPVFYTPNRSAQSTSFTVNAQGTGDAMTKTTTPSPAAGSATFSDGNGANAGGATDIDQVNNDAVVAKSSVLDNNGVNFQNANANAATPSGGTTGVSSPIYTAQSVLAAAPVALPAFRLDTRKPLPGTFPVAPNVDQNINPGTGYVGAAFKFTADSSSGYRGPNAIAGNQTRNLDMANGINNGVGGVTVVFQFRTGSSGSFTSITNTSNINESVASNTYSLRMITTDALGNADTTNDGTFGVDKTPPTIAVTATPANDTVTNTAGGLGSYTYTISDNLSGPAISQLVAVVRNWNGLSSVSSNNEGRINSNVVSPGFSGQGTSANTSINPCYIGRFNATQAAAGANAIPIFSATGAALGFCTPVIYSAATSLPTSFPAVSPASAVMDGYWTATVVALDEAANQVVGFTRTVLEDATAPTITNIGPPATAVGNGVVAWPSTVADNTGSGVGDITGSFIQQTFAAGVLQFPTQTGPGVAFDNVLTNAPTITPQLTNYIKNLQAVGPAGSALLPVLGGNNSAVTVTALGAADLGAGAPSRGSLTYNFQPGAPQLVGGQTNTFPCSNNTNPSAGCTAATWNAGWAITGNNANVSNCPAAGCAGNVAPTKPLSTALTATAGGPTQFFSNPLQGGAVTFWYRLNGSAGPWFFAGNSTSFTSNDNLVNRFWIFSFTFTPPKVAPDGTVLTTNGLLIDLVAVGVNAAGDAVINSTPFTITIFNP
jgi:hypothetical protein